MISMRPGFWTEYRYEKVDLKNHKHHLASAPLGPRQRKNLERVVAAVQSKVDSLNRELWEAKKKAKEQAKSAS